MIVLVITEYEMVPIQVDANVHVDALSGPQTVSIQIKIVV